MHNLGQAKNARLERVLSSLEQSLPANMESNYSVAKCFICFFILLYLLFTQSATAQLAAWDFTGLSSPASALATTRDANLSTFNLTRGPGAAVSAGTNSFRTTGFQNNGISVTNTDYFQISLKALAGYKLSLSTINAVFAGTNTFYALPGVTSQFAYSLDGTNFTLIGSAVTSTSLTLTTIDVTGVAALQNVTSSVTVFLRYYASGQTATGGWGFNSPAVGQNGLSIGGSVVADCAPPQTPVGIVSALENPACGSTQLSYPASTINNVTYYWQTSSSGTSNSTATNGTANYTVSSSGTYYVRAFDAVANCWSLASVASPVIQVNNATVISTQPLATTTSTTQTATFSVTASGTSLTYQWQVNTGMGWGNISTGGVYNINTNVLSVVNPPLSFNGYQYRVIINGAAPCSPVTSNAAVLSVTTYCIPTITTCDEYISKVILNTINNQSPMPFSCGVTSNGYSDYTSISTTLVKGQSYTINVAVGEVTTPDSTSGYINDDIRIWADWNRNGVFTDAGETLVTFNNNGGAGAYAFTVPSTASNGTVRLRVRLVYDNESSSCGNATYGETEDYHLTIVDPCTSGITVSNFYPSNGPAGTWVKIVGTGFTGATGVWFNAVAAAAFSVVSATEIIARVPTGAGTGFITIANAAACNYTTATNFTVTAVSGSCAGIGAYTDLMITEISDPASGNTHYIEVFNGTSSAINLDNPANYSLQVFNDPSTTQTADITGIINSGEVKVYFAGSNGGLATAPAQGTSIGFNQNDEIRLLKNGVVIDRVATPSYVGYNYKRLPGVTSPSTTFVAAQWTITAEPTSQSTVNIGIFNTSPTVTVSNPTDIQSCSVSIALNITPSSGSVFQWKYQDGNTGAWQDVVNGTVNGTTISGALTNVLTITGDLTSYNKYQFYLQVTNSGCIVNSNAAQFIVKADRFFKSATVTGNWSSASSWLMATSSSGPWSTSCTYPTANSSDYISIESGAVITIDVNNLTLDQLTVQTGGTLVLPNANVFTISNGSSGADFTLNGTFRNETSNSTVFSSGATWQMGSSGTFIKTNNSSGAVWQTNYEGGIASIPSTANWIIRFVGSNVNISFTSVNAYYPNLIFESTSGAWTPGVLTKFTGSTGYTIVKGNLDIGGTGTGTVGSLINDNVNINPLLVNGNLIVRSGSTLTNAGLQSGTGFEVKGDVIINGSLINNFDNSGILKFSGTGVQSVSGTGNCFLQNVAINNTGDVQINRALRIMGVLSFGNASRLSLLSGDITLGSTAVSTARVGIIPSSASINYGAGRFVVERYIPADVHGKTWQFLSVPLSTPQTINQAWQDSAALPNQSRYAGYGIQLTSNISPLPSMFDVLTPAGPSIKTYNEAIQNWEGVANTVSTAITNNKGYMVFVRGDRTVTAFNQAATSTTLRACGKLFEPSLLPDTIFIPSNSYRSAGNPYASPIDFTLLTKSASVQDAIYVWDPTLNGLYGLGGYQLISGPDYFPIPGGTANYPSNVAANHIQSGQAFFVKSFGAAGKLSFSENAKSAMVNNVFRSSLSTLQKLRITLLRKDASDWNIIDGNELRLHGSFSNQTDFYDLTKLYSAAENISIVREGVDWSIDARQRLNLLDTVFLKTRKLARNNYILQFEPVRWNQPFAAWLVDCYTNTRTLLQEESATRYSFEVNAETASRSENRFFIVFSPRRNFTTAIPFVKYLPGEKSTIP